MKTISIDIETYSSVNLSKSGVYRYAESPDFEILLFAYSVDGGPVKVIDLASGEKLPEEIRTALLNPGITKWAHNSAFERICLSRWLGQHLDPRSWRCTMVWSAYIGLPLSLEGVGTVLGLEKQKMKEGKDLVKYFSIPCKPTGVNGGRTRNLPKHAPEKWEQFKAYNLRDVETEMAIQEKLSKFPVPDSEWKNYILDQQINDRGVMLDMELVRQAIRCDAQYRETHLSEAREITGLDNPNSTQQLKSWLEGQGIEVDSLSKAAVSEMLENADGAIQTALELRRELAKSSVKKYTAMENAVCSDNRARGLIQFYGANRTGRFSGRLIQVQNLPANHLPDLEQARELVRSGHFDSIEMLYDSVPGVLSELIRTSFVPKPSCRFFVADFTSIERVVLAWLAGEKWVLDAYSTKNDLYIATASQMFHVPVEQINKKSPLRQKGKVADLACIAEGQLVLTHLGLVPIEKITNKHLVWDGISWVNHEGVVYRGIKEVITYETITATPDHLVWVEGEAEPIQLGIAAARRTHLLQTGDGGRAIRVGEDNKPREKMEQKIQSLLCVNQMPKMWRRTMDRQKFINKRKDKRLSELFSASADTKMAGQTSSSCEATLRKPKRSRLSQLWRSRHPVDVSVSSVGGFMANGKLPPNISQFGDRPNRQQQKLRTREYTSSITHCKSKQQTKCSIKCMGAKVLAIFQKCCDKKVIHGTEPRGINKSCYVSGNRETQELEVNTSKVRVYDIRNAGPHNRFTVSGVLVHNCGYGGSVGALKAMGALTMGLSEDELQPLVNAWRRANPNIVRFWWAVDKAAMKAVKDKTTTQTHGIRFTYRSGMLFITLPSGRQLSYVKPRIEPNRFEGESVTYEGAGESRKWMRIESYGAKFVENIVQAASRDLLTEAMQRLDKAGYKIVMHVHDEIVVEAPTDTSLEEMCEIMGQTPSWAKGLPLRADGYVCDFYRKD